jgi:imidazolonepropionase
VIITNIAPAARWYTVLFVKASSQFGAESAEPLLLYNIRQLLSLRSGSDGPRRGGELANLSLVADGAVLSVAGKIVSVGTTREAARDPWVRTQRARIREIDCRNKVVLPGFVDSHNHPAFVSPRLVDFEKRVAGTTYEKIAAAGGGIRSSVEGVRQASRLELQAKVVSRLREMSSFGTTTVEAKSGYGLSPEDEIKSLKAIRGAAGYWPGTVVPTLLGAHVVPVEYRERVADFVQLVCGQLIPQVAREKLARFVDVFCDRGAFSEADSIKIFEAARARGLETRAHISQLQRTPIDRILKFNPASLDHLDYLDSDDVELLARSETVATLVPGANYFLGLGKYPPARTLISSGAAVALATDYNPGSSPTSSMPFVLSLACTQMKMSPAEAIVAATINGAWALRLEKRKGSVEPGKDADLAIFDVQDHREIAYWVGGNLCETVIANGVVRKSNASLEAN